MAGRAELIWSHIRIEREVQDRRWGPPERAGDLVMLAMLVEEVGDVGRTLNENWPSVTHRPTLFRDLVKVAATAVRWLERLAEE